MCDERERLLGYVYDDVDAVERRAIDAHLSDCHVCRAEVAALKGVRQDLLAWDVPAHEPVWRPLAPARRVPWFEQVPAWAMAAAAGVVFAAGVSGGIATRLLWPAAPVVASASNGVATPTPGPAQAAAVEVRSVPSAGTVTPQDLAALEARLSASIRAELAQAGAQAQDRRVNVSARPTGATSVDALVKQVDALERWQYEQVLLNDEFNRKLNRLSSRTSTLDARMATDTEVNRMNLLRTVGFEGGR